jgi:hypothetical protein
VLPVVPIPRAPSQSGAQPRPVATDELSPIERLVERAAREVKILATLAPIDAHRERVKLTDDLRAGRAPVPRWTYAPKSHDALRRALDAAEQTLATRGTTELGALLLARVRELSLEAALCAAAGTAGVARLARVRFEPADRSVAVAASALCALWLEESRETPVGPFIASDDPDPRSLLSRMQETVGRLRLPFRVVASPSLAPLAAIGERAILVATGRPLTDEDARRTVLHEVEGHARPRSISRSLPCILFHAGTARGIDDQEGRALLLEERAGLLGPRRKRQLAARHRAVEAMMDGASFADVCATLHRELGAVDAVVIAERAFRGGDGTTPGLGRERVYLEALVRVRSHLRARPEDEPVLASGQVSIESLRTLADFVP